MKNMFTVHLKPWFLALMIIFQCMFDRANAFPSEESFDGLPLYYWRQKEFVNFGDFLSLKLLERITNSPIRIYQKKRIKTEKKLLAVGSVLYFAEDGDIIWGAGVNGKTLDKSIYNFKEIDVRAVRGPLTRQFLWENFQIEAPEIYGDPALLVPEFFPEFKRKENPSYDYIVILHYADCHLFPKDQYENIVYATDPWEEIFEKITDAKFVISSSLHGIIVAEAFGIPAKWLRVTQNEHPIKYYDYYLGTKRYDAHYATSIEEALSQGGEKPFQCDLNKLYESFPFEYWHGFNLDEPHE